MKMSLKGNVLSYIVIAAIILGALYGAGIDLLTTEPLATLVPAIFIIAGLAIGLFKIEKGERHTALLVAILFSVVGIGAITLTMLEIVTGVIGGIMMYLGMIFVPVGIVVAIRAALKLPS